MTNRLNWMEEESAKSGTPLTAEFLKKSAPTMRAFGIVTGALGPTAILQALLDSGEHETALKHSGTILDTVPVELLVNSAAHHCENADEPASSVAAIALLALLHLRAEKFRQEQAKS